MSVADEASRYLQGYRDQKELQRFWEDLGRPVEPVWEVVQEPQEVGTGALLGALYQSRAGVWSLQDVKESWSPSSFPTMTDMLFQGYRFKEVN